MGKNKFRNVVTQIFLPFFLILATFPNPPELKAQTISGQISVPCSSNLVLPIAQAPITDIFINLNCNVTNTTIAGNPVAGHEIVITLVNAGGFSFAFPSVFLPVAAQPPVNQVAGAQTTFTYQYCGVPGFTTTCPSGTWSNSDVGPAGVGAGAATGTILSPNCSGGSIPCINIPAGGGCIVGAITTSGSGVVTFSGSFPTNPTPIVGELGWVQTQHGSFGVTPQSMCGTTSPTGGGAYTETLYCGVVKQSGGTPITITAVNPGTSVTLSQNCGTTQGGANAVFFYMPNIYTQLQTACLGPNGNGSPQQSIHEAAGLYAVDNQSIPTPTKQSACGCQQISGCLPNTYSFAHLSGEGTFVSQNYTPPWYDHSGDVGTVLAGGILDNISFNGTWSNLGYAHGTPYTGGACGSHDFAFIGFNLAGGGGLSETLYATNSAQPGLNSCEIRNPYILSGDSGIVMGINGIGTVINGTISTKNPTFLCDVNGTTNNLFKIIGGLYISGGSARGGGNGGVIACPTDNLSATGDRIFIADAHLCMTGSLNAINDTETGGVINLSNVSINDGFAGSFVCNPGTNAGGINVASGITVNATQTAFNANGTGVPLNFPTGSTFNDGCNNTSVGGAAFSFAANTYKSNGGCALNAATPTISSGFGTTPSIASGTTPISFRVNVGTGGVATSGVIGLPVAPTGWNCQVTDVTTNDATRQTAFSTNSATFTAAAAWTASDILAASCTPF